MHVQKDYILYETMKPLSYEWFAKSSNGELKNVLFYKNIVQDNLGEVIGLVGTFYDITNFKNIEETLVDSETLFRSYIENSVDIFFTLDTNGCFIYVSPNWTKVLGHQVKDVVGKSFAEFVHPDDIQPGRNYIKKIIEEGHVKEGLEYRAITSEGIYKWQSSSGSILRHKDKIEIIGIAHDISEFKNIENKIHQSYKTYRGLIDQLTESIYIQDENGVFIDVNDSAVAMYGFSRDYMLGKTPEAFAAPNMNDLKKIAHYHFLAYNGQPQSFEFWALKRDGTVFPKEVRMSPGYYFGKKCTIALAFDIRERKNYEEELKRYSSFQKILVDLSIMFINIDLKLLPNAINYALEETGKFINADRAYIYSYDHLNKTTSNIHEWCAPKIKPTIEINQNIPFDLIKEQIDQHFRGEVFEITDVEKMKSSKLKTILINRKIKSIITFPLLMDQQCSGFVGFESVYKAKKWDQSQAGLIKILVQLIVNTDLRALHEKSIIDAKNAAQEANTAKSNFIANISHEIRTPLNSILGFSELLARKISDSKQRQYISIINNSAFLLNDLIKSVLDFSKIEAGKFQLNPEETEFEDIINYVINSFATDIYKNNLDFIINIKGDIPKFVVIDIIAIKQVLGNLLSNALKFTEKGEIELLVNCKLTKNIANMMDIFFEVRDTGIGIEPENVKTIFGLFSQADNTITRRYGGTGLGLAIVTQLLQQMNTTINVESNREIGSRFFFTIRLPYQEMETFKLGNRNKLKTALVIDSDKRNRAVISNMLSLYGYETFEHGEQNKFYDLVLLDVEMPCKSIETENNKIEKLLRDKESVIIGMHKSNDTGEYDMLYKNKRFKGLVEKPITCYSLKRIVYANKS